jgi:hypothetical protein
MSRIYAQSYPALADFTAKCVPLREYDSFSQVTGEQQPGDGRASARRSGLIRAARHSDHTLGRFLSELAECSLPEEPREILRLLESYLVRSIQGRQAAVRMGERLAHQLAPLGFVRGPTVERGSDRTAFVRGYPDELFGSISISQGFGGEAAYSLGASVYCAVVPGWTAVKGLASAECITELGESGWADISDENDALEWEARLLTCGPRKLDDYVRAVGPDLLRKTADIRAAAREYGARGKDRSLAELRSAATAAQLQDATAVLDLWVILIPDGGDYYESAALLIAMYADEVEQRPARIRERDGEFPSDDLMGLLQILASRLSNEPGW